MFAQNKKIKLLYCAFPKTEDFDDLAVIKIKQNSCSCEREAPLAWSRLFYRALVPPLVLTLGLGRWFIGPWVGPT